MHWWSILQEWFCFTHIELRFLSGMLRIWRGQCWRCWRSVSGMRTANSSSWGGSGTLESKSSPESWRSWKPTGQGLPNRGGAWRRQPGGQISISEITGLSKKNVHLCIVAGLIAPFGKGSVIVEMLRATQSWQLWWKKRGREGERLNSSTSKMLLADYWSVLFIVHRVWISLSSGKATQYTVSNPTLEPDIL